MHMIIPGAVFKKRALTEFIRTQLQVKITLTYYSCILMTATRI